MTFVETAGKQIEQAVVINDFNETEFIWKQKKN